MKINLNIFTKVNLPDLFIYMKYGEIEKLFNMINKNTYQRIR